MEKGNDAQKVGLPAIRAVGLRWEGTFAEAGAGGIRHVQQQLRSRVSEIANVTRPDKLLGLSYHARQGGEGFIHYCAVEVSAMGAIPAGMEAVEVPPLSYAKCEHRKGQNIDRSYRNLYAWIKEQGLAEHPGDLTHLEEYPMAQDPYDSDPEFTILIPVG